MSRRRPPRSAWKAAQPARAAASRRRTEPRSPGPQWRLLLVAAWLGGALLTWSCGSISTADVDAARASQAARDRANCGGRWIEAAGVCDRGGP
jgi:hypothetical protein